MTSKPRRMRACDHCGESEKTAGRRFDECTGCRSKVLYCSIRCQRLGWTSHKTSCRRTSAGFDTLRIDDGKVADADFDSMLQYAAKYMTRLKHVTVKAQDKVKVSAGALRSFLQSNRGCLETCHWLMSGFSVDRAREMTNDGRVWMELFNVRELKMKCPVFLSGRVLCQVIEQQQSTIVSLGLISLAIGRETTAWPRNERNALVSAIGQCKNIVRLELGDNLLRDIDVEALVCRLQMIRILLLSGKEEGGYLTDKSCKIISRCCPDLQELDISFHQKISVAGIRRVLKDCQHLRMLQTSMPVLQMKAMKALLALAPNLLFLGTEAHYEEAFRREVIEWAGGRLVFSSTFAGVGMIDKTLLSEEAQLSYDFTKSLLVSVANGLDNPEIVNEWEKLYDAEFPDIASLLAFYAEKV